jgi:hypothetical protein
MFSDNKTRQNGGSAQCVHALHHSSFVECGYSRLQEADLWPRQVHQPEQDFEYCYGEVLA